MSTRPVSQVSPFLKANYHSVRVVSPFTKPITMAETHEKRRVANMDIQVRHAGDSDGQEITKIIIEAFGPSEGQEIVGLIADLLGDPTAQPLWSLVATVQKQVVGHILLTTVHIRPAQRNVVAAILAPLAVLPAYQNRGIGGLLINTGLQQIKTAGGELVFVLGYPTYYSKYGFSPAGARGFEPPYPITPEQEDAWMVQELQPNTIGQIRGTVRCADALADPKYWQE